MSARTRALVGVVLLAVVVALVGVGPVVDGVRALDPGVLAAGLLLGACSTLACAARWRLVAARLGVPLSPRAAVAACYRAQLLNTLLPGGVLGDVDRGLGHARAVGSTAPALRSVVWERLAGQGVQAVLTVAVLLVVPSPLQRLLPAAVAVAVAVVALVVALAAATARHEPRVVRLLGSAWPGIVVTSTLALACHVATYVVAARAAAVDAPLVTLVPLALVVLLAAGLPLNVAGWGPREGVAAWASAAVGLGAAAGLATSVAFGAMVLVANLPGLAVLLAGRRAVRPAVPGPVPSATGVGGGVGGGGGQGA